MTTRIYYALVTVLVITGCTEDHKECPLYYDEVGFAPQTELRDPVSGTCQPFGDYECNDPCTPCAGTGAGIAFPDWGACYSACEGLSESSCKTTSACRAVYAGATFSACWAVAPSGPIEGGGCTGLGAQECSRHDDCVAIHAVGSPIGSFQSCAPEGDVQDPGSCVGEVTCGTAEPVCPSGTIAGRRNGCWTGYCIPLNQCDQLPACPTLDEMSCIDRSDCEPLYTGSNCTCTGASCTCTTWTFDSCAAK